MRLVGLAAALAAGCGGEGRCERGLEDCHEVELGRYLALEPEGEPTGALVFFHGYGGSASDYASYDWIVEGAASRDLLLVLPDGEDHSWSFVGSPQPGRDEQAFVAEVRADVLDRWPEVAPSLLVGGFSIGGSMAWDVACYQGQDWTAFLPISGGFWEPLPADCPGGPVNLRHTHGYADETVPMDGRPIGDAQQGDILAGFEVWKAEDGCAAEADAVEPVGVESCEVWRTCAAGAELRLCMHDGGHKVPDGWMDGAMAWVEALAAR